MKAHDINQEIRTDQQQTGRLARFLGYFSIGLGTLEALAPAVLERTLGIRNRALLRAYGARELAAGAGILAGRPQPWLWARVGGDALDVATLLTALRAGNPRRGWAALALASVLGITALDVLCIRRLQQRAS